MGDNNKFCDDSLTKEHQPLQVGGAGLIPSSSLHFATGNIDEANALVLNYHYSHRLPVNVQLVGTFHESGGLFGDMGDAIAAVFFSIPPVKWSEDVWELSRLVRKDGCQVPLSRLISLACKYAKRKGGNLLVSFADPTHGHHGGVYQACSWNYHGRRKRRIDGIIKDGVFYNQRQCQHLFRSSMSTEAVIKREAPTIGGDIKPHYDEGKHLYWRAITRKGEEMAKRLCLESNKYPKEVIA